MGLGQENPQKHLVVWDKNTVIAIINDNIGSDQARDTIPSGKRVPMSGALQS